MKFTFSDEVAEEEEAFSASYEHTPDYSLQEEDVSPDQHQKQAFPNAVPIQ